MLSQAGWQATKNDNDASPVFEFIPIGSAVAVQWEESRPWTHGMIVSTGDHNHHDRSYTIQLTTNGRCITCNRWCIKPTTITAETHLQYESTKQGHTKTDPLTDILNNINKTTTANVNTHTHSQWQTRWALQTAVKSQSRVRSKWWGTQEDSYKKWT